MTTPEHTPLPEQPARLNKYPGRCAKCGANVAAGAGTLQRARGGGWSVLHVDCHAASSSPARGAVRVNTIRTSGGTFTRNIRGRCEDAPCCGCCTI
jgi:hypothetical protein